MVGDYNISKKIVHITILLYFNSNLLIIDINILKIFFPPFYNLSINIYIKKLSVKCVCICNKNNMMEQVVL